MAIILHLSDLHLGDDPAMGDAKNPVLDSRHLDSRFDLLSASLRALAEELNRTDRVIDCLVISGDVTDRGKAAGIKRLPKLLESLGAKRPDPSRVVVVPGNHDVAKGSDASSAKRYENFLELRTYGYVTPFLEGVDDLAVTAPRAVVASDNSFVIVGLNSADHSMVSTPPEASVEGHLTALELAAKDSPSVAALLEAWKERGEHDIARLSREQRIWGERSLTMPGIPSRALKIVVFHHQLFPVTKTEEGKSFETMTNAGAVHSFLVANEVRLVLHGHKHAKQARATSINRLDTNDEHRLVLLSAPAVEAGTNRPQAIGNLIEVQAEAHPEDWPIRITELPATSPGEPYPHGLLDAAIEVVVDSPHRDGVVVGSTVTRVHDRLLALSATDFLDVPLPLICRVSEGSTCLSLPEHFDSAPVEASSNDWLGNIVDWWQQESPQGAAAFNHGERIRHFNGHFDQLASVVRTIDGSPSSTRAVMSLHYPDRDVDGAPFPSFLLAHFFVRGDRLEVTGYFRKQEIPHWWPVNVAELAFLQQKVISRVSSMTLTAGAITTITAEPRGGRGLPNVAVPMIDREVRTELIERLVFSVISAPKDPAQERAVWKKAFSDWRPSLNNQPEGDDPRPTVGVDRLIQLLKTARNTIQAPDSRLEALLGSLNNVAAANALYKRQNRTEWVGAAVTALDQVDQAVDAILGD